MVSSKANRNLGALMRFSRFFSNVGTLRILYFALVRSHLDFGSVVWSPSGSDHCKSLERIQKRFLRYLYFKDFTYYEPEISYRELLTGYEFTALKIRRDSTLLLFLRDVVNSKIDSASLLQKVGFFVPPRTNCRRNNSFYIPLCRTEHFRTATLNKAEILYDNIEKIDLSIDIFFDSRAVYTRKVVEALVKWHAK